MLSTETDVRKLFTVAGLPPRRIWKLPNGYLGELAPLSEDEIQRDTPGQPNMVTTGPGQTSGVVRRWMLDYSWRLARPAWLVATPIGLIQVTARKRVVEIDWSETAVRAIVTSDSTTKTETLVHAWDVAAAERYLGNLAALSRDGWGAR